MAAKGASMAAMGPISCTFALMLAMLGPALLATDLHTVCALLASKNEKECNFAQKVEMVGAGVEKTS